MATDSSTLCSPSWDLTNGPMTRADLTSCPSYRVDLTNGPMNRVDLAKGPTRDARASTSTWDTAVR